MKNKYTLGLVLLTVGISSVATAQYKNPLETKGGYVSDQNIYDAEVNILPAKQSKSSLNNTLKLSNAVWSCNFDDVDSTEWGLTIISPTDTTGVGNLVPVFEVQPLNDFVRVPLLARFNGGIQWESETNVDREQNILGIDVCNKTVCQYDFTPLTNYPSSEVSFDMKDPIEIPHTDLLLVFSQSYAPFNSDVTKLWYKDDLSGWNSIEIPENASTETNTYAPNNIILDLGTYLTPGASEVQLGFGYATINRDPQYQFGGGYAWGIDDINIIEKPEINLTFLSGIHDTDPNRPSYTHMDLPESQAHELIPSIQFTNSGLVDVVPEFYFEASVGVGNVVFSTTRALDSIPVGDTVAYFIDSLGFTPDSLDVEYTFEWGVKPLEQEDGLPQDNWKKAAMILRSNGLWRDSNGSFSRGSAQEATLKDRDKPGDYAAYSIAQLFFVFNDTEIDSIGYYFENRPIFDDEMFEGQKFNLSVIEITNPAALLTQGLQPTDVQTVEGSFQSGVRLQQYQIMDSTNSELFSGNFAWDTPVKLDSGKYYMVSIEGNGGFEPLHYANTRPSPNDGSSRFKGFNKSTDASLDPNLWVFYGGESLDILWWVDHSVVSVNEITQDNFKLKQNYPNPATGETVISYTLDQAADVALNIFDITGKEVFTKDLGKVSNGSHEVVVNTSRFETGVYFYTLSVDGAKATKRMVVRK